MTSRTAVLAVALIGLGLSIAPARSDEYPTLDVKPLCRGITNQSSLQEGLRSVTFDECLKAEQTDRDTMIKEWSSFSADDKRHCIAEATMGGESSYTDLLTCLEMARDVRALHKEASQTPQQDTSQPAKPPQVCQTQARHLSSSDRSSCPQPRGAPLVIIGGGADCAAGGAGDSTNVSQTFQPSGLLSLSNSP
jgi:hypothetical protein